MSLRAVHYKTNKNMKRLLTLLYSFLLTIMAVNLYAGSLVQYNLTEIQYQQAFDSLRSKGYSPIDIDVTKVGNSNRFAIIWVQDAPLNWQFRYDMTAEEYDQENKTFLNQGYFIQNLVPYYNEQNQLRFTAIWDVRNKLGFAKYHLTEEEYISELDVLHEKGIYPFRVTIYEHEGTYKYAVVFGEIGKVVNGYRNWLEPEECRETLNWMTENEYYIMDLAAYTKKAKTYYSGFWVKLPMGTKTFPKLSLQELQQTIEALDPNSDAPSIITGFCEDGILYYGITYSLTWDPLK